MHICLGCVKSPPYSFMSIFFMNWLYGFTQNKSANGDQNVETKMLFFNNISPSARTSYSHKPAN